MAPSDNPLGSAREEAERFVAAALAAAQFAARQARRSRGRDRDRDRDRDDDRRDRRRGADDNVFTELASLASLAGRFLGDQGRNDSRRDDRRRYDDRYDGRHEHSHAPHETDGGRHFATGSAACCSCPLCRAIDLVRDPPAEFVERVASGASDLASGVVSMLRAFGSAAGRATEAAHRDVVTVPDEDVVPSVTPVSAEVEAELAGAAVDPDTTDAGTGSAGQQSWPWNDFSSVWQAATRTPGSNSTPSSNGPAPMAKKAVAKKAMAKKAVATKAATKKAATKKTVAKEAVAKKTVAKEVAAKKTVAKEAVASKTAPPRAARPAADAGVNAGVAKKVGPSKPVVAKPVAKKPVAKKVVAKTAVAGKAAAGKTAARKTVAKKAGAKKTAASASNPAAPVSPVDEVGA